MQRFTNILVYQSSIAGASFAVRRAAKLAAKNSGRLTIVDVVQPSPAFLANLVPSLGALDNRAEENSRDALTSVAESVKAEFGLTPTVEVLHGRPIVELVSKVQSGNHDLLMKDAGAAINDLFFGSLDMRLLRYCPVPLWLTKPDGDENPRRVLVAVDPLAASEGGEVNQAIIKMASLLAFRDHSELHVVGVWQKPFDLLQSDDDYLEQYDSLSKAVESQARSGLDHFLESSTTAVKPNRIHFRSGIHSEEIVSVVETIRPDTLVIGSLARAGISGVLIGNTAEKVFRRVECSVLTVKPDGFCSPLLD